MGKTPISVRIFPLILSGTAVLLPVFFLFRGGSAWWVLSGALAWLLAVAVKIPASLLAGILPGMSRADANALVNGMISAACELGAVILVLLVSNINRMDSTDLILFAVSGAGIELLVVVISSILEKQDPEKVEKWIDGAASISVRHIFSIERLTAYIGQIGSRGLVGIALLENRFWPFLAAAVSLTITDGSAYFGMAKGWDWLDRRVIRRYFAVTGLLALMELGLFLSMIESPGT